MNTVYWQYRRHFDDTTEIVPLLAWGFLSSLAPSLSLTYPYQRRGFLEVVSYPHATNHRGCGIDAWCIFINAQEFLLFRNERGCFSFVRIIYLARGPGRSTGLMCDEIRFSLLNFCKHSSEFDHVPHSFVFRPLNELNSRIYYMYTRLTTVDYLMLMLHVEIISITKPR